MCWCTSDVLTEVKVVQSGSEAAVSTDLHAPGTKGAYGPRTVIGAA